MALRFNPPPNWPAPPEGFVPPPGWQPDPAWGPAPEGWQGWIDDAAPVATPTGVSASAPSASDAGPYAAGPAAATATAVYDPHTQAIGDRNPIA